MIEQLEALPGQPCPCGTTHRAFVEKFGEDKNAASVHLVEISRDAKAHYHKRMVEIYVVLEGEGEIELDGKRFPVKPLTAIYIKPECRHRAIGNLRIINLPIPAFDPTDEWFD